MPVGKKMHQFLGKIQRHILYKHQRALNQFNIYYLMLNLGSKSLCLMSIFLHLLSTICVQLNYSALSQLIWPESEFISLCGNHTPC